MVTDIATSSLYRTRRSIHLDLSAAVVVGIPWLRQEEKVAVRL
jgi:hypothetical protein